MSVCECCLLVLDSVTFTLQWIRQPKPRDERLGLKERFDVNERLLAANAPTTMSVNDLQGLVLMSASLLMSALLKSLAVEATEQTLRAWNEKLSGLVTSVQLQERKERGVKSARAEEWYAGIR
jgi:hypothetical protein